MNLTYGTPVRSPPSLHYRDARTGRGVPSRRAKCEGRPIDNSCVVVRTEPNLNPSARMRPPRRPHGARSATPLGRRILESLESVREDRPKRRRTLSRSVHLQSLTSMAHIPPIPRRERHEVREAVTSGTGRDHSAAVQRERTALQRL